MRKSKKTENKPVIPLRDMVVFPNAKVPFIVGRAASIEAVQVALEGDREVFLVMQRDAEVREPAPRDLHAVGTVCRVIHELRLPDGNYKLLVEGLTRARVKSVVKDRMHLLATVIPVDADLDGSTQMQAVRSRLVAAFDEYVKLVGGSGLDQITALLQGDELLRGCDDLVSRLTVSPAEKQEMLETLDPVDRVRKTEMLLQVEIDKVRVERKLQRQVQKQVEQAQREYLLNEKMKAIQKELGRKDHSDLEELRSKLESCGLPSAAAEKAEQELQRLEAMPPMSAEATVARSYLDWIVAVPWKKRSRERRDFERAAQVLDEDHHGLEKIKERILEFLAVRALCKGKPTKGSILCLVGPPGVGKTSLGRSIARATGRQFVRLSLGGVRDEAEIRGHRRTYIGAYPGRIIQMMRRAGTRNPVFLLDEIDKMSADFRGDPSAALLEVLDPEQNSTFLDHYLDTDYDLSEVFFICTANVLHSIPEALKDRLEVIRLAGYTLQEKVAIADRFLVSRQVKEHGLEDDHVEVDEEGLRALIEHYTREAGVRELERQVGAVCRKAARKVVADAKARTEVHGLDDVRALLGVPRYRRSLAQREPEVGVATGLAWTEVGGQILLVEATSMRGRGGLTITGQLGDVMQESLRAAVTYVRARNEHFGIPDDYFRRHDIHVHVPEGAIPKDGPSAGITMAAAVISALTGRAVRHDVAMTGEITLRGRVLAVGGIKEKLMAAHRHGISNVLIPEESARELEEIPTEIRDQLEISLVTDMHEVVEAVLLEKHEADAEAAPLPPPTATDADSATTGLPQ